MAQNALLRFSQTNQLLVMDNDDETIAAGLGGGDYPLWIGATQPNGAPFKVSKDGNAYLAGTIKVRNLYTQAGGFVTRGNKKFLDLSSGNTFILSENDVFFLPEPNEHEGMMINVLFREGSNLASENADQPVGMTGKTIEASVYTEGVSSSFYMGIGVLKSSGATEVVTLESMKIYEHSNEKYWTITSQRGVLYIKDSTLIVADKSYIYPDGKYVT